MKLTATIGTLGEDQEPCHILHASVEKDERVEPYVLQQALRQLCDEFAENETKLGASANAVVLELGSLHETGWAVGMATGAIGAGLEYPRVAVFVTAPGEPGHVFCIAQGDMEHYAPGYLNTTRTFPLVDSGGTAGPAS